MILLEPAVARRLKTVSISVIGDKRLRRVYTARTITSLAHTFLLRALDIVKDGAKMVAVRVDTKPNEAIL